MQVWGAVHYVVYKTEYASWQFFIVIVFDLLRRVIIKGICPFFGEQHHIMNKYLLYKLLLIYRKCLSILSSLSYRLP